MTFQEETAVGGKVLIHVQDGDVVVKGRESGDVRVVGQAQRTEQEGNTLVNARGSVVVEAPTHMEIEINGEAVHDVALKGIGAARLGTLDGSLAVNEATRLSAGDIHGDAAIRRVSGAVQLSDVHGDLSVKELGALSVRAVHGHAEWKSLESARFEEVHGHLTVKQAREVSGGQVEGHALFKEVENVTLSHVSGHLTVKQAREVRVETVDGDAELKQVSGALRIDSVEGNLDLKGVGSSIAVGDVSGDVRIRGAWQPGGEYTFKAQGSVELKGEGAAHFIFRYEGELETGEGCEVQQDEDGTTHVYFGAREGAATVTFESEGDVSVNLRDEERDHSHRRHRHHPGDWESHWDWNWEKNGPEVEKEVRRAMEEVRSELHRAKHTVRHELERAMRDVDTQARGPVGGVIRNAMRDLMNSLRDKPTGATGEEPVRESPVTEPTEEVRMILQMIAEGKITPEQGEQLLQAMGEK